MSKIIITNYKSHVKTKITLSREIVGIALLIILQISAFISSNLVVKYNIWNVDKFVNYRSLTATEQTNI